MMSCGSTAHDWMRDGPTSLTRKRCRICGALGWRRGRKLVAYKCRVHGCRMPATRRAWRGTTEVFFCPAHGVPVTPWRSLR